LLLLQLPDLVVLDIPYFFIIKKGKFFRLSA
jgi:hypothetical protein